MYLTKDSWTSLSAYIFIDRKIDSSSSIYLHSRFNNLCDYLVEKKLSFSRSSVNEYLQYKKEQGCKNSYLNNILKVCQYVHEWLLQEKGYDSGCEKLTYFKKETRVYDILTSDEAKAIYSLEYPYIRLKEEKNTRYKALYMLLTLTGMRIGEVLNLEEKDITETTIYIRESKTNVGRVIPNNQMVYNQLLLHMSYNKPGNPYVFQGEDHMKMDVTAIRNDLAKRVECLGLKKRVWLHLFRHSFCVEMLRHNDVTLVAKLMGHGSLSSTLTYSHYLMEDMTNAVMSHPLLREVQPFDVITDRIQEFVSTIIDKEKNTIHIKKGKDTFSICVKR